MKRLLASGSGDIFQIAKAFDRKKQGAITTPSSPARVVSRGLGPRGVDAVKWRVW